MEGATLRPRAGSLSRENRPDKKASGVITPTEYQALNHTQSIEFSNTVNTSKMKKFLIPLFAVAIVATGCSKSGKNTVADGPQPIKLGAGVKTRTSVESDGSGVITSPTSLTGVGFLRADNGTGANWKTATIVDQTTASAGTGPGRIAATLTAASGNNTVTFAPPQYYHGAPTMNAYLRGYHPNTATLTKNASEFVVATWEIDGKTDVML